MINGIDVPDQLIRAFEKAPYLTLGGLAAVIGIDEKTLRAHVVAGDLPYVRFGAGVKRPRRLFGLSDVTAFLRTRQKRDVPCQSTGRKTKRGSSGHRSTSSTSPSEVVDFTVLRELRHAKRRNG
jgi:hypothetical protein